MILKILLCTFTIAVQISVINEAEMNEQNSKCISMHIAADYLHQSL